MAEFFILRKYRRGGTGTAAARNVISRHPGPRTPDPGPRTMTQLPSNPAAVAFWRRAIPAPVSEKIMPDGRHEMTFTQDR